MCYFFSPTPSLFCCTSRPLGVTDSRGRGFPRSVFEWSKVFHWAALPDTLLRHLHRGSSGERQIVFQLLLLLWEIGVTCRRGNRGAPRGCREGGGRVIDVFYYVTFQEELRRVGLQVFNQGWRGAGLCVWKHGPDVMLFFSYQQPCKKMG